MKTQVLVTYATKYGATAEIAEKIGQVLRQAGLGTDVLPTDGVKELKSYKAVVLGSAVYIGRWRKEAATFLKTNEKVLVEQLVWLFSTGPTGKGDPVKLAEGWQFPKNLQSIAKSIEPRDIKLFHGNVEMKKLNFIHKFMIKKVEAPVGDFRNWDAITSWATSIADVLKEEVSVSGNGSIDKERRK